MSARQGKRGRFYCPECRRVVKTVTAIPPGGLPKRGKYYELDGVRTEFPVNAEFDGEVVFCPRGHPVSRTSS